MSIAARRLFLIVTASLAGAAPVAAPAAPEATGSSASTRPAATQPATGPATSPADPQAAAALDVAFTVRYLRYVPPGYAADPQNARGGDGRGWPLVLFLHGSGQRGIDVNAVKRHGPPKLVAGGAAFPFILISPQCPPGEQWDVEALLRLLDAVGGEFKVDPDRVYLTGLSMGGFGAMDLAISRPARFAAVAPVCGGADLQRLGRLKGVPVWAFHGEADEVVPVERSRSMVEALRAAGNSNVKLTTYPGVGHNSWATAYDDPELYRWLLSHRRQAPPAR